MVIANPYLNYPLKMFILVEIIYGRMVCPTCMPGFFPLYACTVVKPGFHYQYPSWRPELTARVDGWSVSITRQLGPLTRAVNSGSGTEL